MKTSSPVSYDDVCRREVTVRYSSGVEPGDVSAKRVKELPHLFLGSRRHEFLQSLPLHVFHDEGRAWSVDVVEPRRTHAGLPCRMNQFGLVKGPLMSYRNVELSEPVGQWFPDLVYCSKTPPRPTDNVGFCPLA